MLTKLNLFRKKIRQTHDQAYLDIMRHYCLKYYPLR